ncbi:MAG: hypothetical protein H7A51_13750 [Akkermansiaceae bacterium]|nr:hypothetical protein [Akkermansiaceae bacterium]MCP5537238.1 hypothetical protein [Akkermansiaceae bacterium]MCP5537247.1 hypothetical protein [Akkermansiaceae bacterium]MCP5537258.1 hypothetical protein [Akkermansiaceae bacterium]MCP5537276.1 hypothetical protein [Akkermansiaceae bacterium]
MRKSVFIWIAVFLFVVGVGYLSKPDRGGLVGCGQVFGLPEIEQLELDTKPLMSWQPFESPKYRFHASDAQFEALDRILRSEGYSDWQEGGVSFGSISHGWTSDEDWIYCKSSHEGYNLYWSYSRTQKLVYAITFPQ